MNCVWITTDSFRRDHVRACRPEGPLDPHAEPVPVRTPSLDALAADSVVFDWMLAEALPTVPQRRGIFTGRRVFPFRDEPAVKGVTPDFPGWRPIPQTDVTVAEHLRDHGYVTAMVADTYHLMKPSMNMHRGFAGFEWVRGQENDLWRTEQPPEGVLARHLKPGAPAGEGPMRVLRQFLANHAGLSGEDDLPVARTFRRAIEWLDGNRRAGKFFLYVDTFTPHEPWLPPERLVERYDPGYEGRRLIYGNPYRRSQLTDAEHRHLRARYAACCTLVDEWVGRLLEALDAGGRADETLVVLMSDHGKIVGEFDHYGMPAADMGTALARVPCMIRHPAARAAGTRFPGRLYNVDVTATVLGLLGVPDKPGMDGRDVWPAVAAGADRFRDVLVTGYAGVVAAWEGDWLYLQQAAGGPAALYDLAADPFRRRELARRRPDVRRRLARRADRILSGRGDPEPEAP